MYIADFLCTVQQDVHHLVQIYIEAKFMLVDKL